MRVPSPVSRGSFAIRFTTFDFIWAFVVPWLALWVRGARVLSPPDWPTILLFCGVAFVSSLVGFLIFRIRDGMTHLFSVHDALAVAKAVLLSEFVTFLFLFSIARLDGIPRSTPLIHALLLAAGLVSARAFLRLSFVKGNTPGATAEDAIEHIIVIGSNRLSSLYIDMLRAYAPDRYRVIAILDESPEMVGRSVAGLRVLGPASHLLPVIEEFKEHGIRADRVIIGGGANLLDPDTLPEVRRICVEFDIQLDFIPQLIGLDALHEQSAQARPVLRTSSVSTALPQYLAFKRHLDFCLSLVLIVLLLPLLGLIAIVVLLDLGSPVYFWQRRIGKEGQIFQLHKFRTLKPNYDGDGNPISGDRISWVGHLLRKFRLDELPQLLNVLVGDMSLIGPRPLLQHDQPPDPTVRLMVRPGITGWAQVNGGKLLTPEEKSALDEWYVRNASLWLDVKILGRTILFMLSGERSHNASDYKMPIDPGEQRKGVA
jgi:lipopolysaccharide/colanic/teichoic acid biosynthesis glycosyltransferase